MKGNSKRARVKDETICHTDKLYIYKENRKWLQVTIHYRKKTYHRRYLYFSP